MTADGGSSSLLDEQALDYLRRRGEEVEFAEGDVILRQGETDAAFWVILRGEIKIVLRSADGGDLSLVRLGPGETFGEMAILRSAPTPSPSPRSSCSATRASSCRPPSPSASRCGVRCWFAWRTISTGDRPRPSGSTSRPERSSISIRVVSPTVP